MQSVVTLSSFDVRTRSIDDCVRFCPSFSLARLRDSHLLPVFPHLCARDVFWHFLRQRKGKIQINAHACKGICSDREKIPGTYGTFVLLDGRLSGVNIYSCKFLVTAEVRRTHLCRSAIPTLPLNKQFSLAFSLP